MTPDAPEKRKPLTRVQFGQLMIDQNGRCACGCNEKLQPMAEGVIDEHVIPLGLLGSNELTNRRLYRKPCAKAKTNAKGGDIPRIAKAKRQHDACKVREADEIPVSRLQSAPFPSKSDKYRGVNGKVVSRAPSRNAPPRS